ncbi:MAG: PIN domain-containing protein [Alphaproteobacteria bacterium]|nr:PIN domain-containing protein [Alphaproteobacteria bacterium]
MAFMLDTNIAIDLRDNNAAVADRIATLTGGIVLSSITAVELEAGVYRDPANAPNRRARLDKILDAIPVLDFTAHAAAAYGGVVAQVGYSRRKIIDHMIAAHAIASRHTLVTRNAADFAAISGLALERW